MNTTETVSSKPWPVLFGMSGKLDKTLKFRREPKLVGNPGIIIPQEFSPLRRRNIPNIRLVSPKKISPINFNLRNTWERYTQYTQQEIFSILAWAQYHQVQDEYLWKIMQNRPDTRTLFLSYDEQGAPCIYEASVDGLQQLQIDIFSLDCKEFCYDDYLIVSNADSLAARKQKRGLIPQILETLLN